MDNCHPNEMDQTTQTAQFSHCTRSSDDLRPGLTDATVGLLPGLRTESMEACYTVRHTHARGQTLSHTLTLGHVLISP